MKLHQYFCHKRDVSLLQLSIKFDHFMKTMILFSIMLIASFLNASCKDDSFNPEQPIVGRWQLQTVRQNNESFQRPSPYESRKDIQIEFHADGTLTGSSSSNDFGGSYKMSMGDSVTFFIGYETKVGESPWGQLFVRGTQLKNAHSADKKSLTLRNNMNSFVFKRLK